MDGEVQPHQLRELRVVEAEHGGVVGGPVLVLIDSADALAVAERVPVDRGRDHWQFWDQIHGILVDVLPTKLCN